MTTFPLPPPVERWSAGQRDARDPAQAWSASRARRRARTSPNENSSYCCLGKSDPLRRSSGRNGDIPCLPGPLVHHADGFPGLFRDPPSGGVRLDSTAVGTPAVRRVDSERSLPWSPHDLSPWVQPTTTSSLSGTRSPEDWEVPRPIEDLVGEAGAQIAHALGRLKAGLWTRVSRSTRPAVGEDRRPPRVNVKFPLWLRAQGLDREI